VQCTVTQAVCHKRPNSSLRYTIKEHKKTESHFLFRNALVDICFISGTVLPYREPWEMTLLSTLSFHWPAKLMIQTSFFSVVRAPKHICQLGGSPFHRTALLSWHVPTLERVYATKEGQSEDTVSLRQVVPAYNN
jgi:hypothetical protein